MRSDPQRALAKLSRRKEDVEDNATKPVAALG